MLLPFTGVAMLHTWEQSHVRTKILAPKYVAVETLHIKNKDDEWKTRSF